MGTGACDRVAASDLHAKAIHSLQAIQACSLLHLLASLDGLPGLRLVIRTPKGLWQCL